MKLKSFQEFVTEAEIQVSNPGEAGNELSQLIAANKGAQEEPKGSNSGPLVNQYLQSTGNHPGEYWCMSFVYYVFNELCKKLGVTNPLPKTASVMDHWEKADPSIKVTAEQVKANPSLIKAGQIFVMSRQGGSGHTGIVLKSDGTGKFITAEGNANDQVSIVNRDITKMALLGFIDYFKGTRTPEFEADLAKSIDAAQGESTGTEGATGAQTGTQDTGLFGAIIKGLGRTFHLNIQDGDLVKTL